VGQIEKNMKITLATATTTDEAAAAVAAAAATGRANGQWQMGSS